MKAILAGSVLSFGMLTGAVAGERTMYVSGDGLNVRLCAGQDCCIANRLSEDEPVYVFEDDGGWARISVYHDATGGGADCKKPDEGLIAHWVSLDFLTTDIPSGIDEDAFYGYLADRRIRGIPKVGDFGLERTDIELIRRYSAQLLLDGTCEGIAAGNKSVSREGTYYVFCEGDIKNRYFTADDIEG